MIKRSLSIYNYYIITYFKGLEGEAYMVALSNSDLPHTDFIWSIIIWVVRRLDLAVILLDFTTADS